MLNFYLKKKNFFYFLSFLKQIIFSSLLYDSATQTILDRETWKYRSEKGHPVHPPNALRAIRSVRPLTQISLASARAFSIPLEKNPVQTLLTPFRGGQSRRARVSREDREDEAWNRRILFSAIDIVRARSRIKLSRAGEMPPLGWERWSMSIGWSDAGLSG